MVMGFKDRFSAENELCILVLGLRSRCDHCAHSEMLELVEIPNLLCCIDNGTTRINHASSSFTPITTDRLFRATLTPCSSALNLAMTDIRLGS